MEILSYIAMGIISIATIAIIIMLEFKKSKLIDMFFEWPKYKQFIWDFIIIFSLVVIFMDNWRIGLLWLGLTLASTVYAGVSIYRSRELREYARSKMEKDIRQMREDADSGDEENNDNNTHSDEEDSG
ncbi:MAG: hypothetical protein R6U31_04680 [bacterium]